MNREKLTVIGNPPWHEYDNGHGSSASPMEDEFVKLGKKLGSSTCFVTPSRGLFGKGKGLKPYTEWMLNREDIVSIRHWENENSPFPSVDMTGGISIIYTDENIDTEKTKFNEKLIDTNKYDILVPETEAYPVLDSVLENADDFLGGEIYTGRGSVSTTGEEEDMHSSRESSDDIVCYASQNKGFKNYVEPDKVNEVAEWNPETSKLEEGWRVATVRANGERPRFGNIIIVRPEETYTSSYIGFEVDSAREAVSLRSYMKTNFANFLLDKRKNSQDISGDTVKWIPVPPLDRIWTDEELAEEELFGLSQEQWKQFTQQDD
jgi:site-specific DNA-methyltransferase (adenine-specific)